MLPQFDIESWSQVSNKCSEAISELNIIKDGVTDGQGDMWSSVPFENATNKTAKLLLHLNR